ncbi:hypothetical protein C1H46_030146 [Malus baccata]|uniref:Uncharacterized protein n=1 Tax=Malus baccata TaxID=106549 RepID=A0A540LCW3_MALBA|nr:hypothetical protein C1H46_030146 [Malus baccata]
MGLLLTINPISATGEMYEPNLKQSTTTETFHPAGPTEYKLFIDGVTKPNHDTQRRRLAPYQLCLPCKCCSATTCISYALLLWHRLPAPQQTFWSLCFCPPRLATALIAQVSVSVSRVVV